MLPCIPVRSIQCSKFYCLLIDERQDACDFNLH